MDSFLNYLLFRITWGLIFIELSIMVVCVVAIIIIKSLTHWKVGRRENNQKELSEIFEKELFSNRPIKDLSLPPHLCQFRNLVEVLEKFDQRFIDDRWLEIKNKVYDDYLDSRAAQGINSWSWFKRQLAGRSYLLCPGKASESNLRKLLNDSKYLVRVVAVGCITQTSFPGLFFEMIKKMSLETKLSQFPYRDALVQMNQEKFDWLESRIVQESDPALVAIYLDVLSTRYSNNLLNLVKPYVNAENKECRTFAIKALGNIPSAESIEILKSHMMDSDWEIRADVVNMLQKLYAIGTIPEIRRLLNDPVWWVRLQAAMALKSFGKEGKEILLSQNPKRDPLAYEISQYILAMP